MKEKQKNAAEQEEVKTGCGCGGANTESSCGCDCGGEGGCGDGGCDCEGGEGCGCGDGCGGGEELSLTEQVDFLTQQLEIAQVIINREKQKTEEVIKLNDRMKAEFDNFRSRNQDNIKKAEAEGAAKVIEKLLPVLDSLDSAKSMIKDQKTIEGLDIVSRQISGLLTTFGVEEIAALGEEFDPNFHNCVSQVKAKRKGDEGKIVGVMQKGYKAGDRIIRHSVVCVAH